MSNENKIHRNTIELLDCQVDLILKSLGFYLNTFENFSFSNNANANIDKELELQTSIIRDTYNQILNECKDGIQNPAIDTYYKIIEKTA